MVKKGFFVAKKYFLASPFFTAKLFFGGDFIIMCQLKFAKYCSLDIYLRLFSWLLGATTNSKMLLWKIIFPGMC